MNSMFKALAMAAMLLAGTASSALDEPENTRTEVIILGVEHGLQLVNPRHQPAALRAFFNAVEPDAICVERSPLRFSRGDHYEFTYEIQDVIVPWARENSVSLPLRLASGPGGQCARVRNRRSRTAAVSPQGLGFPGLRLLP